MDTKKVLTDEELDMVAGGSDIEMYELQKLTGTKDHDKLIELAAAAFKVDKSKVNIEFRGTFQLNSYRIGDTKYDHDDFCTKLQCYLHPLE